MTTALASFASAPKGAALSQTPARGLVNLERRRGALSRSRAASLQPGTSVQHIRGSDAVFAQRSVLRQLAGADETESVEDLSYFLQKPGLMRRTPHLLLMHRPSAETGTSPCAALLLHEFRPLGCATRAFAVSDRSGRGVLWSNAEDRFQLALEGAAHLLRSGANIIMLTMQGAPEPQRALPGPRRMAGVRWAMRTREQAAYLPLAATLDATLASLGQKTRSNLRYYRRRAEAELHCRFVPDARLSVEDLAAFNRVSTFPVPERTLQWRLQVRESLHAPYFMGLQDGDGQWLSLVAGRRFGTSTEILWQMNRGGLPRHSIVSAMRSYHMEHEIGLGATRLLIEGGTPHSMQNSFQTVPVTDLVLVRKGLRRGISGFARRYVPPDNLLAQMLIDPATEWHTCR